MPTCGAAAPTADVRVSRSRPYAYAATVPAGSRLVFLAGACPIDQDGDVSLPGDVPGQAAHAMSNLTVALDAAGARLVDVLNIRVLVATTDREELVAAWDVVHEAFSGHEPPGTLLGVTVLGYPGQLVEVEAVAAVRDELH